MNTPATAATMQLADILRPSLAFAGVEGGSKKRVLERASTEIHRHFPDIPEDQVYDGLIARERLGSTGVGDGVAIPHCRIEACETAIGALMQLSDGVDFGAPDGKPVRLVFVLLVPAEATDEHLQILGLLARAFSQADYRATLLDAGDAESLYNLAIRVPEEPGPAGVSA